jgi:hypothetical protein
VRDILAIFDAPNFSDTDKDARERVVALMAEVSLALILPFRASSSFL